MTFGKHIGILTALFLAMAGSATATGLGLTNTATATGAMDVAAPPAHLTGNVAATTSTVASVESDARGVTDEVSAKARTTVNGAIRAGAEGASNASASSSERVHVTVRQSGGNGAGASTNSSSGANGNVHVNASSTTRVSATADADPQPQQERVGFFASWMMRLQAALVTFSGKVGGGETLHADPEGGARADVKAPDVSVTTQAAGTATALARGSVELVSEKTSGLASASLAARGTASARALVGS